MADYSTLLLERNDAVATITLNRPEAANGMNMQFAAELKAAAEDVSNDKSIRAVILTAQGKMFSAGGDLKSFGEMGDKIGPAIKELADDLHKAISLFSRMDKPLIVAVNGIAAGAGFSLAVMGDIVVAAESAKFTMAYTAAGLSPDGSASYYLPRLIGVRRTQELMLTNRRISAQEAYEWGAVTQVVADDALMETAEKIAGKLSQGATGAYGQVKKLLQSSFDSSLEAQMDLEAEGISTLASGIDGQEGIAAFLEKRAPIFKG